MPPGADDVTVRMQLRDELTRPLKGVRDEVAATTREIKAMGDPAHARGVDFLTQSMGGLTQQLSSVNKWATSASRSLQHDLLIGVRDLALGFTAAAGAATYFSLKAVNSFQRTQAAFATMTGGMAQGQALYNQLMAFNLKSPFDMQPLASSAQTLLGFGFTPQTLMPALQSISNVAAVQQDPNSALERMSLAVGQIQQAGVVRAQDLNQLVQSGFPAYKLLAQVAGGDPATLRKRMAAGADIPSAQFITALSNPNSGVLAPYGGAALAMNNTISGQFSNLTTLVRQEAITAFAPLGQELIKQMPGITTELQQMTKDLAPDLSKLALDVIKGAEAVLPIIEPLVKALAEGVNLLATSGGPFLRELGKADPQITAALGDFFTTLATVEPDILQLFVEGLQVLPPFIKLLGDMVILADPMLKLVNAMLGLGPVRDVVAGLLVALLAYRTLGPAIMAVQSMAGALTGLATAEEAAAVAGGGAGVGVGGVGAKGAKSAKALRGAKALGILGGLAVAAPGLTDIQNRGIGSDLSTVGGLAMTGGSIGGPFGALAGGVLGGAWDLGVHVAGWTTKAPPNTANSKVADQWIDALGNDPKLTDMLARSHSVVNVQTGAIVVHESKDPKATAAAIRDEFENYVAEHRSRQ